MFDNYGAFGKVMVREPPTYLINSFERLGWQDPFPDDDQMMTSEDDMSRNKILSDEQRYKFDYIYPASRILHSQSPQQIYIPNKALMFKLMRACIDV